MARARTMADQLEWRQPRGRAVGSAILAFFLLLLGVGASVGVLGALFSELDRLSLGVTFLVLASLAWLLFACAYLCWRQARGQWNGRIVCNAAGIEIDLPQDRSLVHRPVSVHRKVGWSGVAAIERRDEAFAAQVFAMFQRTYWLALRNGERILLFEDRAIDTPYATPTMGILAADIAAAGNIPLEELEPVEGKGGLLGAWKTRPPAPNGAEISASRLRALHRRVQWTNRAVTLTLVAVWLAIMFG